MARKVSSQQHPTRFALLHALRSLYFMQGYQTPAQQKKTRVAIRNIRDILAQRGCEDLGVGPDDDLCGLCDIVIRG